MAPVLSWILVTLSLLQGTKHSGSFFFVYCSVMFAQNVLAMPKHNSNCWKLWSESDAMRGALAVVEGWTVCEASWGKVFLWIPAWNLNCCATEPSNSFKTHLKVHASHPAKACFFYSITHFYGYEVLFFPSIHSSCRKASWIKLDVASLNVLRLAHTLASRVCFHHLMCKSF